jgi:molecular chaperone IbpA
MTLKFDHTFTQFPFDRFFVGFDPIVKKLSDAAEQATKMAQEVKYPPYNIKKIDENRFVIEMAVAGFCKQDIEIELAGDKLVIKGNAHAGEPAERDSKGDWTWPQVLYQGLAMRPFTRTFTLADNVEVAGAELLNGILKVVLEAIVPEANKPKKIEITDPSEQTSAEFLTEKKENKNGK